MPARDRSVGRVAHVQDLLVGLDATGPAQKPHRATGVRHRSQRGRGGSHEYTVAFVDFLVTKHGLAAALQSDKARFETLHAYFLDRLVPVCAELLDAAAVGEIRPGTDAYGLLYAVGNLCAGADGDPRYDARRMVGLLIAGLRQPHPAGH